MGKHFIKAVEPISMSLFFNHFKHTSVLPSSWDANPPVCHVCLLSPHAEMCPCVICSFSREWYFSECCFPQESWAACAAEVSPQVRSFCLPVLSIAGGSPMWNSGGCSFLSCGFLHNEGRPGALTSLLAPAPASSCCPSNNIFPFKPSYIFYTLFWFMQNFSVCNMRRKSILRPPHC